MPQGTNAGKLLGASLRGVRFSGGTTVPAFDSHNDNAVWMDCADIKHALVWNSLLIAPVYNPLQGSSATLSTPSTTKQSDRYPRFPNYGPSPTMAKRRHRSSSISIFMSMT